MRRRPNRDRAASRRGSAPGRRGGGPSEGPLSLRVRVGPYLLRVRADDERVIRAIRDLAIDDSAVDEALEDDSGSDCALVLSTKEGPASAALPPRDAAAAVFEDVELHPSPSGRKLVVGRGSVVDIDPGGRTARGYVAPLHVLHPWIVAHRIFTLSVIELMRGLGARYLHAGCVSDGDKGILVCGASGQGKSTLTYALARSGFSFVSDDGVFLRRSGRRIEAFSWPEKLKLDGRSCSFFEELRPYADTPAKTEIPLRRTGIGRIARGAFPAALIIPARSSRVASEIAPIARQEAFARVLAQTIPLLDPIEMNAQLDVLSDLVTACRCFELRAATDFDRVASLVRDAVFPNAEAAECEL